MNASSSSTNDKGNKVVGAVRWLCLIALLTLAGFVWYQLYGTGLQTKHAQHRLEQQLATQAPDILQPPPPAKRRQASRAPVKPATVRHYRLAEPIGIIDIPKLRLHWVYVQGTDAPQLALGPGHYLQTPLPGQPGNAALAGHRTTHGHPFYDLNDLGAGDAIRISVGRQFYIYRVTSKLVVHPDTGRSVLANSPGYHLTLTTCHPRYSAARRLIIKAQLVR